MAEALAINNTLTTLHLLVRFVSKLEINDFIEIQQSQYNGIGDEGAEHIAQALKTNNTLKTLNLGVRL